MNKNFIRLVAATSIICFTANYFMLGELKKIWRAAQTPLFDFHGQWALCAYTLRGIDSYSITGLATPTIEDIGIIPAAWSTTPWGLLLGNFFYPGFMTAENAAIYFLALNLIFLLITTTALAKRFKFAVPVLPAFLASFFISLYFGNAGAVICCLLILTCLCAEEQPILAGVLLSLAMVKPQVTLPICFALLFRKNFKVLITAALIDCAAWGISALLTNQTPLTLLTEFLSINTGGGFAFAGLFTLAFIENTPIATGLSMLAGILFIRLTFRDERYFWACPAFLTTTFFAYSFHNEFFVLIMPALCCVSLADRADSRREKIFWLSAFIFMSSAPYVLLLSLKIFVADLTTAFWLARTIFAVVLILVGFFAAKRLSCAK